MIITILYQVVYTNGGQGVYKRHSTETHQASSDNVLREQLLTDISVRLQKKKKHSSDLKESHAINT